MEHVIARWSSPRSRKQWIELLRSPHGAYSYRGDTCAGTLATRNEAEAIAYVGSEIKRYRPHLRMEGGVK